jgi:malonyl CoA-acyl carrier protein transacylase
LTRNIWNTDKNIALVILLFLEKQIKIVSILFQGLKFKVVPSKFEENLDKTQFNHPKDYVLENAKQKALEVAKRMSQENKVSI